MSTQISLQFDRDTVAAWLRHMATELTQYLDRDDSISLIGIRRGGVDIARLLQTELKNLGVHMHSELGELNIAFYRDDFSSVGLHPIVGPSHVPFPITDQHIVLIDDVLGTGRTVRAAMNEIFDYGRPARITLAVLVQRIDHELPIRAQVLGHELNVSPVEYIEFNRDTLEVTVGPRA